MRPNWNPRCFCRILWQPVTCFQLFFFFLVLHSNWGASRWKVTSPFISGQINGFMNNFFFPSLPFFFDCPSEKGTRIVFLGTSGHLTGQLQFPNVSTSNEWMKRRISFFFLKKWIKNGNNSGREPTFQWTQIHMNLQHFSSSGLHWGHSGNIRRMSGGSLWGGQILLIFRLNS